MIHFEQNEPLEPASPDTMTPMIDVILSLIAFMMLMINAPLLTMDVNLPEVEQQEYQSHVSTEILNLTILEHDSHWRVNEELVTSNDDLTRILTERVINTDPNPITVLSIDRASSAQRMIETLDILNRLGIKNAQIAIEKESAGS